MLAQTLEFRFGGVDSLVTCAAATFRSGWPTIFSS